MNSFSSDASSMSNSSLSEAECAVNESKQLLPPESITQMDKAPETFDITGWKVEPPAGLQFVDLVPLNQGYELAKAETQRDSIGKIRAFPHSRRQRHSGPHQHAIKTTGRDIYDTRKLRQAVSDGNFHLVESLIQSGVDPSAVDDKKRTPLHIAAAKGNQHMVSLLLNHGADPSGKDIIGNTPLHLAACTHHVEVVTLLLRAGTDINALDNSGNTPLHLARSRLRLIQDDLQTTSESLKAQVTHIVDMMKEYLGRSGQEDDLGELDRICEQLQKTNTRQELDSVGGLLSEFANLQIQKHDQPG